MMCCRRIVGFFTLCIAHWFKFRMLSRRNILGRHRWHVFCSQWGGDNLFGHIHTKCLDIFCMCMSPLYTFSPEKARYLCVIN